MSYGGGGEEAERGIKSRNASNTFILVPSVSQTWKKILKLEILAVITSNVLLMTQPSQ
jgi:hypothetical protein